MRISSLEIPGVLLIEPAVHGDARGFFLESYRRDIFRNAGVNDKFVQDNHSHSGKGVLRGLHYQLKHPQAKLVRAVRGAIFDVAVDVRRGSPTFGQWVGEQLSEENKRMLYVPAGFAHGFCTLAETTDVLYKCSDYHHPQDERGILWSDPDLAIEWPEMQFLLSERDRVHPVLKNAQDLPDYR
ncbi:MAG: dTDP-4-dehydrorhamnose 3,5-epimerase [Thiogranum sp.]|nr:dTDP-4-dehydrorhamnose 3,5-epimerase [Thiogranum sp.]